MSYADSPLDNQFTGDGTVTSWITDLDSYWFTGDGTDIDWTAVYNQLYSGDGTFPDADYRVGSFTGRQRVIFLSYTSLKASVFPHI